MPDEDYLYAVTVGERVPHNDTVELAPYDPHWPSRFAMLAERIRAALDERVFLLEHVGSTSVPGLCAKPVIDIVLAVPDSADEPSYVPALEAAGFRLRIREPDWFAHRCFECLEVKGNLHVFTAGCEEIARMLRFRDWLRAHDEDRRAYEDEKRELAARKWKHVQDYADAKTGIVHEILARAFSVAEG
jgi:GrpB-like predicted nucleotidyltransferase (UPF0157 family)